jgi:hypothetical protein
MHGESYIRLLLIVVVVVAGPVIIVPLDIIKRGFGRLKEL